MQEIYKSLDEVKKAFGALLGDMYDEFCRECVYPDCMGYIHVLPSELDKIIQSDVDLVLINDNVVVIDSLEKLSNGQYNLEARKPCCKYRKNGKCTIHNVAPFTCSIYPFGFFMDESNNLYFTLSRDCAYTVTCKKMNNFESCRAAINILKSIDMKMLKEIVDAYYNISNLSKFPEGVTNSVYKLARIRSNYEIEEC